MRPKLSVVIPIHPMQNGDKFLWRTINMLIGQSFQDFEIVITRQGKMAENTNAGIRKARGELIKILYLDDTLAHKDSLKEIVEAMGESNWLVSGCTHTENGTDCFNPHFPSTDGLENNENTIGSPSVLTIKNGLGIYFDETMTWLLDVDVYKRLLSKYGEPVILDDINVVIGVHEGQTTNLLSEEIKNAEFNYLKNK